MKIINLILTLLLCLSMIFMFIRQDLLVDALEATSAVFKAQLVENEKFDKGIRTNMECLEKLRELDAQK